jgi:hypothetical protein
MHNDTMSENDKVMIRWTITGTAKKELFGIPAYDHDHDLVRYKFS